MAIATDSHAFQGPTPKGTHNDCPNSTGQTSTPHIPGDPHPPPPHPHRGCGPGTSTMPHPTLGHWCEPTHPMISPYGTLWPALACTQPSLQHVPGAPEPTHICLRPPDVPHPLSHTRDISLRRPPHWTPPHPNCVSPMRPMPMAHQPMYKRKWKCSMSVGGR